MTSLTECWNWPKMLKSYTFTNYMKDKSKKIGSTLKKNHLLDREAKKSYW